jgi:hypothetical protein
MPFSIDLARTLLKGMTNPAERPAHMSLAGPKCICAAADGSLTASAARFNSSPPGDGRMPPVHLLGEAARVERPARRCAWQPAAGGQLAVADEERERHPLEPVGMVGAEVEPYAATAFGYAAAGSLTATSRRRAPRRKA